MSCVDFERHEVLCPHRGGTQVAWRAADGCSGRLCPTCWRTYAVAAWPDLAEEIAGPREGLDFLELLRVIGGNTL